MPTMYRTTSTLTEDEEGVTFTAGQLITDVPPLNLGLTGLAVVSDRIQFTFENPIPSEHLDNYAVELVL